MLKLKRRDVTMPTKINVRGEFHGEAVKTACDIVLCFLVDRHEMSSVLRRPDAWRDHFEEKGNLFEPKYGGITDGIKVLGRFVNSKAKFILGTDMREVDVEDATIHGIKLEPQVGGMTMVELTISAIQTEPMKDLQDYLGPKMSQKLNLSIGKLKEKTEKEKAAEAQGKLELGEGSPASADAAIAQDQADQALADQAGPTAADEAGPYKAQTKKKRVRIRDHAAEHAARKAKKGKK
jgi:hypothetical protein